MTGRYPTIAMPIAGADDPRLGQRGVEHPTVSEVALQMLRHAEDAAELADVLAP